MMIQKQNRREFIRICTTVGAGLPLFCMSFMRCGKSHTEKSQKKENVSSTAISEDFDELGYCGYACKEKCKVYSATKNNDYETKIKMAKSMSEKYNQDFKPEDVHCDGCKSERPSYFASNRCTVRECAQEKQLVTCAYCKDFSNCDKDLWTMWPEVKELIEEMRRNLSAQQKT